MLLFKTAEKCFRQVKVPGSLKGSLTRYFRLQVFFMNQCPPGPQVFHWSLFEIFAEICGDFRELMFITGVNDTGDKLFSGVNDTSKKFIFPRCR
jgi:hypothetical protein